ncbi:hypothetical protein PB2503_04967 [Parvularcula bermudensis HTCC2503]|uniref:DUF2849 domain-containing protein n=1 Tax=Parvularcula bermudensis (strain ATCC BAA-594 / HTCC2503 / KCTC 12087) TaxID=314260 RepID=E0TFQ3_PARBH|nr:DUF2849 domain-containing protein [Parvularcula bermudensis]ADM09068.1 hypothetical protein PB2503_04967 [Parvularcula bermudensis HTCC2503]
MSAETGGPRDAPAAKISAGGVKKGKNVGAKVVTANDLMTGAVIYLKDDAGWTEDLRQAVVAEGDEALSLLDQALADEAHAVGPYLMDVAEEEGVAPTGRALLREQIRDTGPTIHPEFRRHFPEAR